jgi:hypothetical protein
LFYNNTYELPINKLLNCIKNDTKKSNLTEMKVEVFIGSVSAELLDYQRQEGANIL